MTLTKKKYRPFCSGYKGLREKSVNVTHKVLNKSPTYVFYPEKGEVEKHPENVEFLILSAHFSDETSPIKTSNVSYIPIYKITTPEDRYFHEKIYFWKDKYKSIYALWIHGHKEIEKFTLKQLADPKSELSAEGMEICRKVEEILNKKVFYSLRVPYYKRDSQNKEIDLCPSCKSYWKLEEDLLRYFGYKCDKCLLLGILTHAF